jgi:ABC-2 type transport system permease protein
MRSYWAFIRAYTLLTARDWSVVVLSHVIPLAFLIGYIQLGVPVPWALSMALVFAIVTNGVFGAGVRVVQERQLGVLRRLRAAPISAAHIVIGAVASGLIVFVPALLLLAFVVLVAHGARLPEHPEAFVALIAAGMLCCRSLGVLVAAITLSVQQSQLVAQMLIVALLFTSAMAWSPNLWPAWILLVRDLSPSYHLTRSLFGVLADGNSADQRSLRWRRFQRPASCV